MKITLTDQDLDGSVVSWHRSVRSPFAVPLVDDGTGMHQDLRRDFFSVDHHAAVNRVGTAFKIRWWLGKTVYWTWRRPRGAWSADARRALGKTHPELQLVCFVDVPAPGFPIMITAVDSDWDDR
jgi:hypothetical protein